MKKPEKWQFEAAPRIILYASMQLSNVLILCTHTINIDCVQIRTKIAIYRELVPVIRYLVRMG